MDLRIVGRKPLQGQVQIPADKSITHRSIMLASLSDGTTTIDAPGAGADNDSTADLFRSLGVSITRQPNGWVVEGKGLDGLKETSEVIDCGNSGTTIRLVSGILAGAGLNAQLTGDHSLCKRPMGRIAKPLRAMGAAIEGNMVDGKELPPLTIAPSQLGGGEWTQAVASAQVKSALLFAGLLSGQEVTVHEPTVSRDHTEQMLTGMGVTVKRTLDEAGHHVTLAAGARDAFKGFPDGGQYRVPGDISSAAFWMILGLIVPGSSLALQNVGLNPSRTGIVDALESYGIEMGVDNLETTGGEAIGHVSVATQAWDASCPDITIGGAVIPRLIDELVVLGALAAVYPGQTLVKDAEELRVKESDRVVETVRILRAFGVEAEECPDGFLVRGGKPLQAAELDVSSDHRVAMSAAVLACAAEGESVLHGFDVAGVSYPGFVDVLKQLGAHVTTSA